MMNGMSTLVEAAMIATKSAPPGLDALNPAYQLLDITALGRQEENLPHSMAWVRLHDEYGA